jgi:uncharacterized protein
MIFVHNPIVLDTSILISAALFPGSIPEHAMVVAFEYFDVVISEAMLDELRTVLARPKYEQYASVATRFAYVEAFATYATTVGMTASVKACHDPTDDKVLALAESANSPIIVSGEKDLLSMHPFREIEILSARQFVDEFS